MRHSLALFTPGVLLLCPGILGASYAFVDPPAGPPAPLTLAAALQTIRPPEQGVVLAIAAETVKLPTDAAAPGHGATVDETAAAFGRLARRFGSVTAVAPPTIILLNSNPALPDLASLVTPDLAFQLLAGSLTPDEWQKLVSPTGLGLNDLPEAQQQAFFRAALPEGQLHLDRYEAGNLNSPWDGGDVKDSDLAGAHFRLIQKTRLDLPTEKAGTFLDHSLSSATGRRYSMYRTPSHIIPVNQLYSDSLDGVRMKLEMPNTLKRGQMDLDAARFKVPVPLNGLRTVADLISRIGKLSHTSLYADARYEALSIEAIPSTASAPASDLLKALALCVTGTYRVVGPAALLTHDLAGYGAQVERLAEFQVENRIRTTQLSSEIRRSLSAAHTVLDLPPDPDAPAFSPEQAKELKDAVGRGFRAFISTPFDQLTLQQQALVQRMADEENRNADVRADTPQGQKHPEQNLHVDLTRHLDLNLEPSVEVLLPSLDAPVDTRDMFFGASFMLNPLPSAHRIVPPSGQPLSSLLQALPRRAAVVAPGSEEDLDALVASMRRLGLNELWLVVFSSGMPWQAPKGISGEVLLHHALEVCPQLRIRVFPVLDLLDWGAGAPADLRDRNILGEDSALAAHRAQELTAPFEYRPSGAKPPPNPSPWILVTPFSAVVTDRVRSLAQAVVRTPGISGVVWRVSTPPGYLQRVGFLSHSDEPRLDEPALRDLGYTDAARLSFLRQFHVDPVDINPIPSLWADVSLPLFGDRDADDRLRTEWQKVRREGELRWLAALYTAVQQGPDPLPLLLEVAGPAEWFGTWDDVRAEPPGRIIRYTGNIDQLAPLAKRISRSALITIGTRPPVDPNLMGNELKFGVLHTQWDGCVLDFDPSDSPRPTPGDALHPLEANTGPPTP